MVTAGHDSPGMNAGVRIFTRMALDGGYKVFGADYGFEGLLEGEIRELEMDGCQRLGIEGRFGIGCGSRRSDKTRYGSLGPKC